jgi:flavin reductase (DIM6/NTAB) family NADH-FMN oxidoreductase RutF
MLRFDPAEQPTADIYKLMIGMVVPRPIAFISSLDAAGIRNLAPFSYFMACSADPPVICFVASGRPGPIPTKDTLRNVLATKEFVVNIVSADFADKMNVASAEVAPEVDEFVLSGLTSTASERVQPPRVGESRAQMECRLRQTLAIGVNTVVFGDVLLFHVDEKIVDGYKINPEGLDAIGRMGGPTYCWTRERFEMTRPK